ncbi:MAG: Peptidylprolyl isomerase [Frankiales bacterium]|nr:Peptidylprolyl isomerase [Frankiales bacterium]
MTRTPRWAAAAALCLALAACGGGDDAGDDPTLSAPSTEASSGASAAAPAADCPTQLTTGTAPASVSKDLKVQPKVPANTAAAPTTVTASDVVVGTGAEATAGKQVAVKYVGALDKSGKEFDSSWSRGAEETLPFTVCGQEVVPGFSVAPLGMKVGGRRIVQIPEQFGYVGGNPGAGIAAGDVITFVIDLVSVQ